MKKFEDFSQKLGEDQKKRSLRAERLNFSPKSGEDQEKNKKGKKGLHSWNPNLVKTKTLVPQQVPSRTPRSPF